MSDEQEDEKVGLDEQVYDPLFVVLLVAQMLAHHPPASSLEWVQTFRSNVFSLLIRCLSAKDEKIREASLGLLARVWKSVEVRAIFFFVIIRRRDAHFLSAFRYARKATRAVHL
jgi:nucleolar pre-ribosomal-associated protein 1